MACLGNVFTVSGVDPAAAGIGLQGVTSVQDGHCWDESDLLPVSTSSVKLTALSIYLTDRNGLVEIEFYIGNSEFLTEYCNSKHVLCTVCSCQECTLNLESALWG